MGLFRCVLSLALISGIAAVSLDVTPIEKVISLIEGLKDEVETDGKNEAKAYEEFACFCQKTTEKKSNSVKSGNDKIGSLSSNIADKTQAKIDDSSDLLKRQKDQEAMSTELEQTKVRCAKEKAEYQAEEADLSQAIQGLKDAIKVLSESRDRTSLLEMKTVRKTLEMADAMGLITPKHKAVTAFLQQTSSVDPDAPKYGYHSDDIITECEELLKQYKEKKSDLDDDWSKTEKGCIDLKKSLGEKMSANKDAMNGLKKSISKLEEEIADHREDLIEAESTMKDDELYLKDLTKRCEDRANDYDQRSAMRNDELTAFTEALKILTGTVKGKADAAERALIQEVSKKIPSTQTVLKTAVSPAAKMNAKVAQKSISFLQKFSSSLSEEARTQNAIAVLRKEGQRLHSLTLKSLAERISAPRFSSEAAYDPFKKVKGLIQKLIERLLEESKAEASKKGFCDTELAKARKDRDFRWTEANDLSADLAGLEAKEDALTEEIKKLKGEIKEETQALKETTDERNEEKKANLEAIKTAKEGFEAVNEALLVLKSFYKQAAKAAFVQASPVDEDTAGAGFSGNYKGKQSGAQAIFALLETISSDFDRTLRTTEAAENAAHREFVEFSQTTKASIAGKSKKQELDEADLKTTKDLIASKSEALQTAMDLLDKALEELEELKPTCIDTGMSYAERVAKREEEIKALQNAHCLLKPGNEPGDC